MYIPVYTTIHDLAACLGRRRHRVAAIPLLAVIWTKMGGAPASPSTRIIGGIRLQKGSQMTTEHTAIVTGANHGIGAATARALARQGCAVLCAYFRVIDPAEPRIPGGLPGQPRPERRARPRGDHATGGRAVAMEADLSDPATARPAVRPRRAAARPGRHPGQQRDRLAGRHLRGRRDRPARPVAPAGDRARWTRQFTVDAMGAGPDDRRVRPPPHRARRRTGAGSSA